MIEPNEDFNNRIEVARLHHEETLRDQIATAALTGLLAMMAHPQAQGSPDSSQVTVMSRTAYGIADAMLLARKESVDND